MAEHVEWCDSLEQRLNDPVEIPLVSTKQEKEEKRARGEKHKRRKFISLVDDSEETCSFVFINGILVVTKFLFLTSTIVIGRAVATALKCQLGKDYPHFVRGLLTCAQDGLIVGSSTGPNISNCIPTPINPLEPGQQISMGVFQLQRTELADIHQYIITNTEHQGGGATNVHVALGSIFKGTKLWDLYSLPAGASCIAEETAGDIVKIQFTC
ncbi:hypothetical protein COCVIDRAFT_20535 [Bipolaris victoriae FI3]|uniref:Uncharacterized protein n=1 Tax=Bipolaris victoriae (strain FI3) TaxID=930091 RepID=W7DTY7_BIPV3|nr:hypothetical protein COCVIDRAFT_20535 [Bipolaris victoriae FI3]